ncbi:hypothetical protein L195_g064178, partial [Trifolium pratense]
ETAGWDKCCSKCWHICPGWSTFKKADDCRLD